MYYIPSPVQWDWCTLRGILEMAAESLSDLSWADLSWSSLKLWIAYGATFAQLLAHKTSTQLIFHIGLFIVPLDPTRRQSGAATLFALRRFSGEVGVVPFLILDAMRHNFFYRYTVPAPHFVQNWTGNMLVKVVCFFNWQFTGIGLVKLKIADFTKNWPLTFVVSLQEWNAA